MNLKIVTEKIDNGYVAECTLGERKVSFGDTPEAIAAIIKATADEWVAKTNAEAVLNAK